MPAIWKSYKFFASHAIEVTHVRREGPLRHLCVNGQALTLPMPASPDECLRIVRDCIAAQKAAGTIPFIFSKKDL